MSPDTIRKPHAFIRAAPLFLVLVVSSVLATGCGLVASQSTKIQSQPHDQAVFRSDSAPLPPGKRQMIEASLRRVRETTPNAREAGSVTIPVYFHILTSADGQLGKVSCDTVQKQIEVLNNAFAGKDPAAPGTVTPFRFVFAGLDVTANDRWFTMQFVGDPTDAEREAKKALNRGDRSTLNIYTIKPVDKPFGWTRWPWDYDQGLDGVVIWYTTLPGGTAPNYSDGDTATHEVGHWLGLFHTFEGGCQPPGDSVDDTEPQAFQTTGCPTVAPDTCPGGDADPLHNFMNFVVDRCMYAFTAGQSKRMDAVHLLYRTEGNGDISDSGK